MGCGNWEFTESLENKLSEKEVIERFEAEQQSWDHRFPISINATTYSSFQLLQAMKARTDAGKQYMQALGEVYQDTSFLDQRKENPAESLTEALTNSIKFFLSGVQIPEEIIPELDILDRIRKLVNYDAGHPYLNSEDIKEVGVPMIQGYLGISVGLQKLDDINSSRKQIMTEGCMTYWALVAGSSAIGYFFAGMNGATTCGIVTAIGLTGYDMIKQDQQSEENNIELIKRQEYAIRTALFYKDVVDDAWDTAVSKSIENTRSLLHHHDIL